MEYSNDYCLKFILKELEGIDLWHKEIDNETILFVIDEDNSFEMMVSHDNEPSEENVSAIHWLFAIMTMIEKYEDEYALSYIEIYETYKNKL